MAKGVTIDLIVDPKGAVSGLNVASEEAKKSNSILEDLGKVGAKAIAAIGAASAAAGIALVASSVSAAAYADEILTAATNTNLSTEELQAYKYAAEQIDVSFETFTSTQGKLVKSMQTASSGTGAAAEAFSALGLSVTDSSGQLVDSTQLYWDAIDALAGVENETERTALAQQIFGKSAAELNSLIQTGSEGFAELTEAARANGAIMSGEQLEKLGAFDDKLQSLYATVEAAKNAFGLTLLPVLDQLAGDGGNALGEFTAALLEADGDLSKAGPAFESLGSTIAETLTTAIPKILEVGASLISGLIAGIVAQAPSLIQTAIPLIVAFASGLLAMLPSILDAGLKIVLALVQGLAQSLPQLIPAAVDAVLGLVDALILNLPLLLDAGLQLVLGLALGIVDAIPYLLEALPELITALITGLIGAIPQLVTAGVQLIVAIVENLPAIIEGVISAVPAIVNALVSAFGDPKFWEQMGEAGLMLIEGLWEGIKGAGDWLWKNIQSFFGDVIDNIKNLFGIRSPSTLFAGFGEYMIEGLEQGLTGPNHLAAISSGLVGQVTSGLNGFDGSIRVQAQASLTSLNDPFTVGATAGVGSSPQVTNNISLGPDMDPRLVGRQFGREFARVMAGSTA